ncbi:hypothetical protein FOA43_000584 [Brettanomyces nanus]|uniref:Uncharacterized protein n=1 Tax=Eeniella nana TaxID=13502 RepID=A0A875RWK9_EENNA|nr:uncharacterized protein FOA43_000584 [Brettanomyces nanus]QPG73276.1 hypothetical protein FOA43_000584 [Brettanomyces nanus]
MSFSSTAYSSSRLADHSTQAEANTISNIATTVITITSCADNKCTKNTLATGVSSYTTTVNNVVTVLTTYCPLISETISKTTNPTSSVDPDANVNSIPSKTDQISDETFKGHSNIASAVYETTLIYSTLSASSSEISATGTVITAFKAEAAVMNPSNWIPFIASPLLLLMLV